MITQNSLLAREVFKYFDELSHFVGKVGQYIPFIQSRIKHILKEETPDFVVLQCGGNDVQRYQNFEVIKKYEDLQPYIDPVRYLWHGGKFLLAANPLLAAGWVAGFVQAWVKQPTVADLEDLPEDITSIRGFWRNPVSRILLVVALANLGSSIGTFVAGSWIAARVL